jgi:outer membrane immunogenic protein
MKKLLLTTVSVAALVTARPALAAPPMPGFSWTGCYVGGHIGGGWGEKSFSDVGPGGLVSVFGPPNARVDAKVSGFLGGAQLGCNYQFAPMWIVGLQGDFAAADISGDTISPFTAVGTFLGAKMDWLASATARFGYAVNNNWLLYAKGGAAWAHDKYTAIYGATFTGTETRGGWTIGGGLEWAFMDNWSAMLEYDFYDFGTKDVSLTAGAAINVKQYIGVVKFGINYRFSPLH